MAYLRTIPGAALLQGTLGWNLRSSVLAFKTSCHPSRTPIFPSPSLPLCAPPPVRHTCLTAYLNCQKDKDAPFKLMLAIPPPKAPLGQFPLSSLQSVCCLQLTCFKTKCVNLHTYTAARVSVDRGGFQLISRTDFQLFLFVNVLFFKGSN